MRRESRGLVFTRSRSGTEMRPCPESGHSLLTLDADPMTVGQRWRLCENVEPEKFAGISFYWKVAFRLAQKHSALCRVARRKIVLRKNAASAFLHSLGGERT